MEHSRFVRLVLSFDTRNKKPYYLFDLEISLVHHCTVSFLVLFGYLDFGSPVSFYHTACHTIEKKIVSDVQQNKLKLNMEMEKKDCHNNISSTKNDHAAE